MKFIPFCLLQILFITKHVDADTSDICLSRVLYAQKEENYLTTPNYPREYPKNRYCTTIISTDKKDDTITLTILSLSMEGICCDYLSIYSGEERIDTNLIGKYSEGRNFTYPLTIPVNKSKALLFFHSDGSISKQGFRLSYKIEKLVHEICKENILRAETAWLILQSPSYPRQYSNNLNCSLILSTTNTTGHIEIYMAALDLERGSDILDIYAGSRKKSNLVFHSTIEKKIPKAFVIKDSTAIIQFTTDKSKTSSGFQFSYRSIANNSICSGKTLTAEKHKKYLTSPGFPLAFVKNINCTTEIKSEQNTNIEFQIESFDLEEDRDFLEIFDNDLSHKMAKLTARPSLPYLINTKSSLANLRFTSLSNKVKSGFKLSYRAVPQRIKCESQQQIDITFVINNHHTFAQNIFQDYIKDFIKNVANDYFDESQSNKSRFAIVIYGNSQATLAFNLNNVFVRQSDLFQAIQSIQYQPGDTNDLNSALNMVRKSVVPMARKGNNVKHFVLIIDLFGTTSAIREADLLKETGASVYVISEKESQRSYYEVIASRIEYVSIPMNFESLLQYTSHVADIICHSKPEFNLVCVTKHKKVDLTFLLEDSQFVTESFFKHNLLSEVKTLIKQFHKYSDQFSVDVSVVSYGDSIHNVDLDSSIEEIFHQIDYLIEYRGEKGSNVLSALRELSGMQMKRKKTKDVLDVVIVTTTTSIDENVNITSLFQPGTLLVTTEVDSSMMENETSISEKKIDFSSLFQTKIAPSLCLDIIYSNDTLSVTSITASTVTVRRTLFSSSFSLQVTISSKISNNSTTIIVESSATFTNLHPFTEYEITWKPTNPQYVLVVAPLSLFITTLQSLPSEPRLSVNRFVKTNTSVILRWTAPESMNGVFHHYETLCNITNQSDNMKPIISQECFVNVSSLQPATKYKCSVFAVNSVGKSNSSQPMLFYTRDSYSQAVRNFQLKEPSPDRILLIWQPPLLSFGKIKGYVVFVYRVDKTSGILCQNIVLLKNPDDNVMTNTIQGRLLEVDFSQSNCSWKFYQTIEKFINDPLKMEVEISNLELPRFNYTFEVYPINGAGPGQLSQTKTQSWYEEVNVSILSITPTSISLQSSLLFPKPHPLTEVTLFSQTDPKVRTINMSLSHAITFEDLAPNTKYMVQWRYNYGPYWYKNRLNQPIKTKTKSPKHTKRIIYSSFIVLVFIVLLISVVLLVLKRRRKSNGNASAIFLHDLTEQTGNLNEIDDNTSFSSIADRNKVK